MIKREILEGRFDKLSWVQLARCENVGPKTLIDLIKLYKDPQAALDALPEMQTRGGAKRKFKLAEKSVIEREFEQSEAFGAKILCPFEDEYPKDLQNLTDMPNVLTIKGKIELLASKNKVAIVGARNSSVNGCKLAGKFAENLSKKDYMIVSGLAKGIDASAHCASLDKGTIGVIAAGIDNIYPPENKNLYEKLFEQGLVITEMPFGSQPIASNFPKRNRIISGLSQGTLIIEAALKSGTLITADYAKKQGKMIFAVPGSPLDARHKGTNKLLKEGAIMAEDYMDVIQALENRPPLQMNDNKNLFDYCTEVMPKENELNASRDKVHAALSPEPTSIEDLAEHIGLELSVLNYILLELELAGRIERVYGNKIQLIV